MLQIGGLGNCRTFGIGQPPKRIIGSHKRPGAEGHGGEMCKGLLQFSKFGAKVLHTPLRRAEESKNATLNGQEE